MGININCIHNDNGAWCHNPLVKKSLWGIGARCCSLYPPFKKECEYQQEHKRPDNLPPPPPQKRKA